MDNEIFLMLKAAVNMARNENVRSLTSLKTRLLAMFPDNETSINNAIQFWSEYEKRKPQS